MNVPAIALALLASAPRGGEGASVFVSAPPLARAEAAQLVVHPLSGAPADGARYPRLALGGDGVLRVAFTAPVASDEGEPAEHAVRYASVGADGFGPTSELERGPDHFVNWADAPLVTADTAGRVFGAWLRTSGAGPYAYGVQIHAGGAGARRLHDDDGAGEHGFVSLVPGAGAGDVDAVWLDGRATAGGHGGHDAHGGHGGSAMQLRTRRVSLERDGEAETAALGPELLLDDRVCDCCQTSAARLADGTLVVAYRDRGDDERRDVSFVRVRESAFGAPTASAPAPVANDGWIIEGCPVNGPELVARGDRVACVWFTEAPSPRVNVAVSSAGAESFGAPLCVAARKSAPKTDEGVDPEGADLDGTDLDGTGGRASVAWLADGSLLVTYFVETDFDAGRAEWRVRRLTFDGEALAFAGGPTTLAAVDSSRRSGFARIAALPGEGADAVAVWTDVDDGYALRAARVSPAAGGR